METWSRWAKGAGETESRTVRNWQDVVFLCSLPVSDWFTASPRVELLFLPPTLHPWAPQRSCPRPAVTLWNLSGCISLEKASFSGGLNRVQKVWCGWELVAKYRSLGWKALMCFYVCNCSINTCKVNISLCIDLLELPKHVAAFVINFSNIRH